MEKLFVVRCYDSYDGYTFDYHCFANKAAAKAYARHAYCPYNVDVSCWETGIEAPVGEKIGRDSPFFSLLEKDGYYME